MSPRCPQRGAVFCPHIKTKKAQNQSAPKFESGRGSRNRTHNQRFWSSPYLNAENNVDMRFCAFSTCFCFAYILVYFRLLQMFFNKVVPVLSPQPYTNFIQQIKMSAVVLRLHKNKRAFNAPFYYFICANQELRTLPSGASGSCM